MGVGVLLFAGVGVSHAGRAGEVVARSLPCFVFGWIGARPGTGRCECSCVAGDSLDACVDEVGALRFSR